MKGHVARKRDRYYAVIYEGLDPVTGKERRSWHPAGTDRSEAEALVARLAAERDDEERRDPEDRVQRGEGRDGVAEPRVLHHRDRALAAELGAGEILLNSMDADGTTAGFDLAMLRDVRREVRIPLIASGGAGTPEHFAEAADAGADAVLAASVFHFGTLTIGQVKEHLRARGHVVR